MTENRYNSVHEFFMAGSSSSPSERSPKHHLRTPAVSVWVSERASVFIARIPKGGWFFCSYKQHQPLRVSSQKNTEFLQFDNFWQLLRSQNCINTPTALRSPVRRNQPNSGECSISKVFDHKHSSHMSGTKLYTNLNPISWSYFSLHTHICACTHTHTHTHTHTQPTTFRTSILNT
jgi:hypothetical protein